MCLDREGVFFKTGVMCYLSTWFASLDKLAVGLRWQLSLGLATIVAGR